MEQAKYRIEVFNKRHDPRSGVIQGRLVSLGYMLRNVYITDNYLLDAPVSTLDATRAAKSLTQPVTQDYRLNEAYRPPVFDFAVEIGFLPGVTDNISHTVRESIEDLLKIELDIEKSVFTSITYFFEGDISATDAENIATEFYNPLIQRIKVLSSERYITEGGMGRMLPVVHISDRQDADTVDLSIPDVELMAIAKEGIADSDGTRRGPLALDMASMHVIRDYFLGSEKRNPTDIEMESIAQTWSEHCKHTIFAAGIDEIDEGIYKRYIKEATIRIRREKGDKDFCLSVFEDNSGGIEFDENYIISDKVETHNSPSALDPFGGSITGIVGVNRDSIGFGMGARPIANRYGFCFADPSDTRPLYRGKDKSTKLLPPRRIMEGVISGVNAGGNTSGIPTPQGFVYFDERYKGKPLVFVGTVGLIPKTIHGKSSVKKKANSGDNIVMIGGRVGRDGIHGATFSSEALSSGSPATAVQIGDPITQKKLSDAIVKEARDLGLYNSITDNGAGGLSCSVAEMARECGGFVVDLEKVPLKYPGLSPWQIWISESQERMTLSVPDARLDEFIALMKRRGVETAVIGRFNAGSRGVVNYNGKKIFDLDMKFLHEGLPAKKLVTSPVKKSAPCPEFDVPENLNTVFLDMAGRLNTAGFEFISTQYDHEVQANSCIKPQQGKGRVNGSATVIRPLFDSYRGAVLSQGLYPSYSELDPYRMAACSIDTAVRNAVCAGGSLDALAILDNFCWCDSSSPERLSELKEAARACYDYAVAYGTPFISGKDSMFNDFKGYDENFNQVLISIPPTLLISSIGIVNDVRLCQTVDFKFPGDLIYVLGVTADETGGSEYQSYRCGQTGGTVPNVDAEKCKALYRAIEKAVAQQLVSSCVSVERGGIGVAIAKSAIGGRLGFEIGLSKIARSGVTRSDVILFSESQGRAIVSVEPSRKERFEALFSGLPCALAGKVTGDGMAVIQGLDERQAVKLRLDDVTASYKNRFSGF